MKTLAQWLQDDESFVTTVMAILTDAYGLDFLEWDPMTISMELRSDFGIEPDDYLMDKIGCGSSLFTSNLFFKSLETFNTSCNVLGRGVTVSETFLPADLEDVLWGIAEAKILLVDIFDEEEFSHDIARYVGQLLERRGVYEPPPMLAFAEFDEESVRNMGDVASAPEDMDLDIIQLHFDKLKEARNDLNAVVSEQIDELRDQLRALPLKVDLKVG